MLRKVLIGVHLVLILIFSGLFHWTGGGGFVAWLTTILTSFLLLFAIGIALTFVIAQVPMKPFSLTFKAYAAEYFSAVKLFCMDAIRQERVLIPPQDLSDDYYPILFIHGFSCNSGFWRTFVSRFKGRWHNYMATINLEPLHSRIDTYDDQIDARIEQLLTVSGKSQCLIVAHSMGGLATRSFLEHKSSHHKVKGVVTLGTPHSGTMMANLAVAQNASQMRRLSGWLDNLREQESNQNMPPFEALIGTHDNIVSPQECASYDLATNTYLTGMTHIAMAYDRQLIEWTLQRLQRLQSEEN